MPRGGNHPKHPKCPGCKKALYKTQKKGTASKKEDPFCHCRNEACELFDTIQDPELPEEEGEGGESSPKKDAITTFKNGPVELALLDCQFDNEVLFVPRD